MSTTSTPEVVGTARDRVDGRLKVMGAATYPVDVALPGMAYAVLLQSTVTSGRIRHIAVDAAEQAPGVLAVITHLNAKVLAAGPVSCSVRSRCRRSKATPCCTTASTSQWSSPRRWSKRRPRRR